MKLRENLSTPPFLDHPLLSAFYLLSANFRKLQPPSPLGKGVQAMDTVRIKKKLKSILTNNFKPVTIKSLISVFGLILGEFTSSIS